MGRFKTLLTTGSALAVTATAGLAQDVTLTVHHFLGPRAPVHAALLEPWAERIEAESEGRIAIELFPSMSMGGRPPELYRQVRDGFADIVWTLPGYTPGVFPRAEVFELPSVHQGSAAQTNAAIQAVWADIAADFEDIHPLLLHVHAGNAIHLREGSVATVEDVEGLSLRTPSRTGAWMIEAWGAEPVGMPVPELPQALARGVVDGALVPFEVMPPLGLHEMTTVSVEGPEASRFGTATFLLAMNQERYDELPEDLRAIIDANSGAALAEIAGEVWDSIEDVGRNLQTESGGELQTLSAESKAAFDALGAQVEARWIEETADRDFDGAALVEAARAAVAAN